ncbi:maleate cis-trans isomerase family protein [Paenibacillus sp. sgz302251]|uniref:maleate cis-trans isomerase family protein n=1 Tax=Paenibacillus sp. sgz302251 TaxID=3414493 RepID=UPI003C7A1251
MKQIKLGMLTPSSNTVLEPITCSMLQNVTGVAAHFSRFKVTEVSLSSSAANQFLLEPMLEAAYLLADAKVDVIAYNGTSGGWLGFENDRRLCEQITRETGIPATTSVLALNELFSINQVKRFGIVSPCEEVIVERIVNNYAKIGLECTGYACSGISDNYECAFVTEEAIREMARSVALPGVDAITMFGTNLMSAHLVEELEREHGILIVDTIAAVVWKCLLLTGISPQVVSGWGKLFEANGVKTS